MSIKILLADDSITIQKVVGIIFGGEEYSLTVVDNGKTAVEKARELDPDVLLIDALMPGMSGYEVCEAVRSTPSLATKPILLLTGSFEPFDENKAKTCGADDFIAKPFESQQIIAKIKELYELGKGRIAAPAEQSEVTIAPALETSPEPLPDFVEPTAATIQQTTPPPTPALEVSSPFETTSFAPEPAFAMPSAAVAPAAPALWDAFTPEEPVAAEPVQPSPFTMPNDDVFAMVQEEPEPIAFQTPAPEISNPHIDSQWIPVEEQSFQFQEETIAELPPTVFDEPAPPVIQAAGDDSTCSTTSTVAFEPSSFGDLPAAAFDAPVSAPIEPAGIPTTVSPFSDSYQEAIETAAEQASARPVEIATATATPAMTTPAAPFLAPDSIEPSLSSPVAVSTPLTEEQLKAALSSVSKEVIERIVWEVVPDLAEVLIKEAIRKIKNGI